MKITLTVVKGPDKGRKFSFDGHDTFIVGRARSSHLRLPARDPLFSRNHFMLEVNPPLCRLTDMASRNGTFVNDQRVAETDLQNGDLIHGGNTTIRVEIEQDETPRETRQITPVQRSPERESRAGNPTHQHWGNFEIVRELGRGAMGVVYLALSGATRQQVALKRISPQGPASDRDIQRFVREASILKKLRHPNIVECYEFGSSDGEVYMSMEFVPGEDAQQLLDRSGPLPVWRATRIVGELLRALSFSHAQQFVHRDIKPANVLMVPKRGRDIVKLSDFGLAKVYQASRLSGLTMQGEMGGSIAFIPPEQITNYQETAPASDLYSTAASLYTLLTGHFIYDFPERMSQRLLMILQDPPVPIGERRSDLPAELEAAIHRGLEREPSARFSSAGEMRQALMPFTSRERR